MLILWRLGCLTVKACLLRYPTFLNTINVNKVVEEILKLFRLAKTFMLYTRTIHSLQIFMFVKSI